MLSWTFTENFKLCIQNTNPLPLRILRRYHSRIEKTVWCCGFEFRGDWDLHFCKLLTWNVFQNHSLDAPVDSENSIWIYFFQNTLRYFSCPVLLNGDNLDMFNIRSCISYLDKHWIKLRKIRINKKWWCAWNSIGVRFWRGQ